MSALSRRLALFFGGLCVFALITFAAPPVFGTLWVGEVALIKRISVSEHWGALLWKEGGRWDQSIHPCSDTQIAIFDITTDTGKAMLDTALLAFNARRRVDVYTDGCSIDEGWPIVIRMDVIY